MRTPGHIAFIMDGNGRWAEAQGLSRSEGHKAGFERIPDVLDACLSVGIPVVSAFAWSTENGSRPAGEVDYVMGALERELTRFSRELDKRQVRFHCSGELDGLSPGARRAVAQAENTTLHHSARTFNLALNYGARQEIVHAVQAILADGLSPDRISEDDVGSRLWTRDLPDVDLLVRTGKESRLSNFMLWQCAKAHLCFLDKHWPDIDADDINQAIEQWRGTPN